MGVVYEARHVELERPVAVKVIRRELSIDPVAVARFEREARAAAALDCEHIAAVHDIGRDESGIPFFVMDLLRGRTLRSLLDTEGPLQADFAVLLTVQLCRGLAVAHAAGIVHRDVKPANVFVCQRSDGTALVKLLDFGVARLRDDHEITRSGAQAGPLGSLKYMAPEQARCREPVDHRADLYSVGVILYEALTGSNPQEADEPPAVLQRILFERPLPLQRLVPGLPAGLCAVIDKAMAHEPEDRYGSADELARALAGSLAGAKGPAGLDREGSRSRWAPLLLLGGTLVLLAFAAVIVWRSAVAFASATPGSEAPSARRTPPLELLSTSSTLRLCESSPGVRNSIPAPSSRESKSLATSATERQRPAEAGDLPHDATPRQRDPFTPTFDLQNPYGQ